MPDCQPIIDEIAGLKQERADLQEDLRGVPREPRPGPSQKQAIVAQIKKITSQIAEKEGELRICLGLPAPLPPLICPLVGATASLASNNPAFPGPFAPPLAVSLTFSGPQRSRVDLSAISFRIGPVSIPRTPCSDLISVTVPAAGGTYDPVLGEISIPVTATVNHALSGGFLNICALAPAAPSTAASPLTTGTLPSGVSGSISGVPLSKPAGTLTLVASGVLAGGPSQIAGTAIDLTISGTLNPQP